MVDMIVFAPVFRPTERILPDSRFREKRDAGFAGEAIETVRGVGYRLRCGV